jgi:hypothetical protein
MEFSASIATFYVTAKRRRAAIFEAHSIYVCDIPKQGIEDRSRCRIAE